jgi:hypothetical protein
MISNKVSAHSREVFSVVYQSMAYRLHCCGGELITRPEELDFPAGHGLALSLTVQQGPHLNRRNPLNEWYSTNVTYFIEFRKSESSSKGHFGTLYLGTPRNIPDELDRNSCGSREEITNRAYVNFAAKNYESHSVYRHTLFVTGLIIRADLSVFDLKLDNAQGVAAEMEVNGKKCVLKCHNQTITNILMSTAMQHMLVLHTETHQSNWTLHLLLLDWQQDVAYRIAPVELTFSTQIQKDVFDVFKPVRARFVLG